jgi:ABC-2 type transport system ATP-binding protein
MTFVNMSFIQVENVYKYFEDKCVSNNISLEIPEGEIFGLLGPNGAGKTTLIRMLATITTPDKGKISLNNQPLNSNHSSMIGYMPEERGLYKKMSVVDQLLFFAELKGYTRTQAKQEVKFWMNKLDIVSWADKKMEELSKGMAQKIQFISTILHKPKFLILDEPFSGFDPVNADMVKDLIISLKNEGTTILFSTHRMDNIEELCDQLAIIHNGVKILDGKINTIRQQFFNHEYILEFTNSDMDNIETSNNQFDIIQTQTNSFGRKEITFKLKENQSPQELYKQYSQSNTIIGFREKMPTIHQIFVNQVTSNS